MPSVRVDIYQEEDGECYYVEWVNTLEDDVVDKLIAAVERLEEFGHELRRPRADYLRDGIYELRVEVGTVNYRVLYFFFGRVAAIISHGITKKDKIPANEIDRAVDRKRRYEQDPQRHTYVWEPEDDH
ncbi:MAG TPA: type II toxin-antitoxin system RelE/ParE family toxin [Armatimonadota bacterium]|nr:type II toxin-antitoxin system RelE/ParE family toxin [Armatimonadota bacterium]